MATIAGIYSIRVGGEQLALSGDASVKGLTIHKEGKVGPDGFHGTMEKYAVPMISGTFVNVGNGAVDFAKLQAIGKGEQVNVSVASNNGRTYMLYDAYVDGEVDYNPETGDISVTFGGRDFRETN